MIDRETLLWHRKFISEYCCGDQAGHEECESFGCGTVTKLLDHIAALEGALRRFLGPLQYSTDAEYVAAADEARALLSEPE